MKECESLGRIDIDEAIDVVEEAIKKVGFDVSRMDTEIRFDEHGCSETNAILELKFPTGEPLDMRLVSRLVKELETVKEELYELGYELNVKGLDSSGVYMVILERVFKK